MAINWQVNSLSVFEVEIMLFHKFLGLLQRNLTIELSATSGAYMESASFQDIGRRISIICFAKTRHSPFMASQGCRPTLEFFRV